VQPQALEAKCARGSRCWGGPKGLDASRLPASTGAWAALAIARAPPLARLSAARRRSDPRLLQRRHDSPGGRRGGGSGDAARRDSPIEDPDRLPTMAEDSRGGGRRRVSLLPGRVRAEGGFQSIADMVEALSAACALMANRDWIERDGAMREFAGAGALARAGGRPIRLRENFPARRDARPARQVLDS